MTVDCSVHVLNIYILVQYIYPYAHMSEGVILSPN